MHPRVSGSDDSNTQTTKIIRSPSAADPKKKGSRRPASLMLIEGPQTLIGTQWPLEKKSITIGRYATSEIQITEKSLSKVHARVTVAEGIASIADLESTNGTSLNGKKLTPYATYQLRHNDQIKAGSIVFKFLDEP